MIHHHSSRNFYESHRIIMSNVDSSGYDSDVRKSPSSTIKFPDNSSMASSDFHGTIQATICFDIPENNDKNQQLDIHKNYYTDHHQQHHKIMDNYPHSSSSGGGNQVKILTTTEEPSSSIPDLGEYNNHFRVFIFYIFPCSCKKKKTTHEDYTFLPHFCQQHTFFLFSIPVLSLSFCCCVGWQKKRRKGKAKIAKEKLQLSGMRADKIDTFPSIVLPEHCSSLLF